MKKYLNSIYKICPITQKFYCVSNSPVANVTSVLLLPGQRQISRATDGPDSTPGGGGASSGWFGS